MFIKLDDLPSSNESFAWCDYVELRCLTSPDNSFSKDNLLELLGETIDLTYFDLSPDSDYDDLSDSEEVLDDTTSERNDRWEAKVSDIFRSIDYRNKIFTDAYPFQLDDSHQELRLVSGITPKKKLYLQLLFSSLLKFVERRSQKELTEPFEKLSCQILACLMPKGWKVHQFGAAGSSRYKGHIFDKFQKLSEDIRCKLMVAKEHFSASNSGDGGIDIVAWHPLGEEKRIGIPFAIAQCGCTTGEWGLKSLTSSQAYLNSKFHIINSFLSFYFMPLDLVSNLDDSDGWSRRGNLTTTIIIDRYRIIKLAEEYHIIKKCITAPSLLRKALNSK